MLELKLSLDTDRAGFSATLEAMLNWPNDDDDVNEDRLLLILLMDVFLDLRSFGVVAGSAVSNALPFLG